MTTCPLHDGPGPDPSGSVLSKRNHSASYWASRCPASVPEQHQPGCIINQDQHDTSLPTGTADKSAVPDRERRRGTAQPEKITPALATDRLSESQPSSTTKLHASR